MPAVARRKHDPAAIEPRANQRPTVATKRKPVQRRLPREKRRAEILRVATRIFHTMGYEAASFQDIADAMGVKKAALYYYFSSKQELLETLLADILRSGVKNIVEIAARKGDSLTRLWQLVAGHVEYQCMNLPATSVYLHERRWISSAKRTAVLHEEGAYLGAFVDAIRRGQSDGQILPAVDPQVAARSILGSTNWIYTWFKPGADLAPVAIGAQFATMTINSLAPTKVLKSWTMPQLPVSKKRPASRLKSPKIVTLQKK